MLLTCNFLPLFEGQNWQLCRTRPRCLTAFKLVLFLLLCWPAGRSVGGGFGANGGTSSGVASVDTSDSDSDSSVAIGLAAAGEAPAWLPGSSSEHEVCGPEENSCSLLPGPLVRIIRGQPDGGGGRSLVGGKVEGEVEEEVAEPSSDLGMSLTSLLCEVGQVGCGALAIAASRAVSNATQRNAAWPRPRTECCMACMHGRYLAGTLF